MCPHGNTRPKCALCGPKRTFPGTARRGTYERVGRPKRLGVGSVMKRVLLGGVAAAALNFAIGLDCVAHAEDRPVRRDETATTALLAAAHNWTGFYFGVNAGAVWGSYGARTSTEVSSACLFNPLDVAAVNAAGLQTMKRSGFAGGGLSGSIRPTRCLATQTPDRSGSATLRSRRRVGSSALASNMPSSIAGPRRSNTITSAPAASPCRFLRSP